MEEFIKRVNRALTIALLIIRALRVHLQNEIPPKSELLVVDTAFPITLTRNIISFVNRFLKAARFSFSAPRSFFIDLKTGMGAIDAAKRTDGACYMTEAREKYALGIEHLQKCLLAISHSKLLCRLQANIFLDLTLAFSHLEKKTLALLHLDRYLKYRKEKFLFDFRKQLLASIEVRNSLQSEHQKNKYSEAIKIHRIGIAIAGDSPAEYDINLAGFYSATAEIKKAIFHIEEALNKGFDDWDGLLNDELFSNVIHTKEFAELYFNRVLTK